MVWENTEQIERDGYTCVREERMNGSSEGLAVLETAALARGGAGTHLDLLGSRGLL